MEAQKKGGQTSEQKAVESVSAMYELFSFCEHQLENIETSLQAVREKIQLCTDNR